MIASVNAPDKKSWSDNLHTEVRYWEFIISGRHANADRVRAFRERASGQYSFPSQLKKYLRPERTTRILDVGAGPHTVIGTRDVPTPIHIVAIDPLAREYDTLLEQNGITPKIRTVTGEAEKLSSYQFGTFDLVYSRNALDHSYDPVAAIEAMRSVLNPDGFIFLEGSVNEGQKQKYHGLHRWNFQPEADGDLIVWSQLSRISLREKYPEATINAIRQDQWYKVELSFPSNREDD